MAQQYSLKWNNHQPNFISMFGMLRNTQTLVDVTLAAEGRHLHAHKMVLSACSPYFHSLFVDNPSRHPIVILKDVAFSDLRTIVDFMYYGEVNITQEELPQMLHSAKSLKVKGLTETESTSVMRSQSSDYPYETACETSGEHTGEPSGEQSGEAIHESANLPNDNAGEGESRVPASPSGSPSAKRRRRRRSSNGSTSLNVVVGEENENHMELARDGITLSSVPRRRDFFENRDNNATQQDAEPPNINIEDLHVDHNPAGMPQELMSGLRLRRATHLKRQPRVEERMARRQASEPSVPLPPPPPPTPFLRKHHSYPQFAPRNRRPRPAGGEQQVNSMQIHAVAVNDRQPSEGAPAPAHTPAPAHAQAPTQAYAHALAHTLAPAHANAPAVHGHTPRASHTPAVRSGPPLSCNFCWNTVDECGRILRRKTQYHCPECRTNLCIVPCFHEYHEAEVVNAR